MDILREIFNTTKQPILDLNNFWNTTTQRPILSFRNLTSNPVTESTISKEKPIINLVNLQNSTTAPGILNIPKIANVSITTTPKTTTFSPETIEVIIETSFPTAIIASIAATMGVVILLSTYFLVKYKEFLKNIIANTKKF